jgi:glutamate/tyrosine decarboxylase-like PLP-dependent enzyme
MAETQPQSAATKAGVVPLDADFVKFAEDHCAKLVHRLVNNADPNQLLTNHSPDHMEQQVPIMPPETEGKSYDELSELVDKVLELSVRTGHPMYYNQLWAEADPMQVLGEMLATTLNTSMFTYEVAGLFILIEKAIVEKLAKFAGFEEGRRDGILCPGGSLCNLQALAFARHWKCPELKEEGMFGKPRMVLFASAEAHYSIEKAAFTLGLGKNSVISVPCHASTGIMDSDALERLIEEQIALGHLPFFVHATAGTTVRGAFDPFEKCAELCTKHKMWFHVDGAWGGSLALSKKYNHLCKGIDKANSMTWDIHKMLGAPQQLAVLLLQDKGELALEANGAKAQYLFQKDKPFAQFDIGDRHIQCGRRNDVLKFWLSWQQLSDEGLANRIDHVCDLSRYMAATIKQRVREGFVLLLDPQCTNVCFMFVPKYLRDHQVFQELVRGNTKSLLDPENKAFHDEYDTVAPRIKAGMVKEGSMMCGFQRNFGMPNFWRLVICSPRIGNKEIDNVLNIIQRLGDNLVESNQIV